MKILLAVVMSMTVTSSVWAACAESSLGECTKDNCATVGKGVWKEKADLATNETIQCVKMVDAKASQTPSVCPGVNDKTAPKDGPAGTDKKGTDSGAGHI